MSMIKVKCTSCGQTLDADETWVGAELQCLKCKNHFIFQEIESPLEPPSEIVEDIFRESIIFQTKRNAPPSDQAEAEQQLLDAASNGDLDGVKYLVEECHANIEFADENGYTPLLKSCISGNNHILYTPPEKAAKMSEIERRRLIVKYLIEKGANVNAKAESFTALHGRLSTTALHLTDDPEIAELLLTNGANIKALDEAGNTPLSCQENYETVEVLLKYGSNVNYKGENGWTALHYNCAANGIANSHINIIKKLLSLGADVNASNHDGETPLHKTRSVECAKLLLSHGADINKRDDEGKTPLLSTAQQAYFWFHDKNDKSTNSSQQPNRNRFIKYVSFLLNNGANIHDIDYQGHNFWHYFAYSCLSVDILKEWSPYGRLLDKVSDEKIRGINCLRRTPMDIIDAMPSVMGLPSNPKQKQFKHITGTCNTNLISAALPIGTLLFILLSLFLFAFSNMKWYDNLVFSCILTIILRVPFWASSRIKLYKVRAQVKRLCL